MISFMTKLYICKRAKEKNKILPQNYCDILKEAEKTNLPNKIHLRFSWWFHHKKYLNASSSISKSIFLNPEWAFYIIFYNNDKELKDALSITIGHELTHKEKDFSTFGLSATNKMFVNWVNELHADFGAVQKMANSNRQKLLDSMEYKRMRKDNDENNCYRPSWTQKIHYVKHYDFGKELIQQIAMDTGCKKQNIIDEVCEHFQEINLNP